MKPSLKEEDFVWAANELNCEVAAIKAVAQTESAGAGFYPNGEPLILFEAHVFSRLTGRKFDQTHPHISAQPWGKAKYGPSSIQHKRLQEASQLNRDAALQSCSWGKFQLMGFEWKMNGYQSLQDMINAMYRSERDHLYGFVNFIKSKKGLWPALINKDWPRFAYLYNGPGYRRNKYDEKMAYWYRRFS